MQQSQFNSTAQLVLGLIASIAALQRPWLRSIIDIESTTRKSMFVRLGTDYEIRNGEYFESIKNGTNHFRCDSFQMAIIVES